jgi:U3 small nucleolar RNA-associated protein 20
MILVPLLHLTDTQNNTPFSTDTTFPATYTSLTTSAQELLAAIQEKLGDKEYISAMTRASRAVRERRADRRQKRAIEKVADPESAARRKKIKGERQKKRKKEVGKGFAEMRRGRV